VILIARRAALWYIRQYARFAGRRIRRVAGRGSGAGLGRASGVILDGARRGASGYATTSAPGTESAPFQPATSPATAANTNTSSPTTRAGGPAAATARWPAAGTTSARSIPAGATTTDPMDLSPGPMTPATNTPVSHPNGGIPTAIESAPTARAEQLRPTGRPRGGGLSKPATTRCARAASSPGRWRPARNCHCEPHRPSGAATTPQTACPSSRPTPTTVLRRHRSEGAPLPEAPSGINGAGSSRRSTVLGPGYRLGVAISNSRLCFARPRQPNLDKR
jgi:hypothetical protein